MKVRDAINQLVALAVQLEQQHPDRDIKHEHYRQAGKKDCLQVTLKSMPLIADERGNPTPI